MLDSMTKYKTRHDYLIVRSETVGLTKGGVAMPDVSAESKRWRIVGRGPDAKTDVKIGDVVILGGTIDPGEKNFLMWQIPSTVDLYIIRDRNVIAVVGE